MNILTCLKNQRSILKIKNNYSEHSFENIREFEELQEKIVFSNWDISIIDNKIFFDEAQTQEAVDLLTKKSVQVVLFEGDFEVIFEQLDKLLSIKEEIIVEPEPEINEVDDTPIRYVEKETIKEVIKEVKVIKKEYKHMYSEIENKSIGIMNLSRGAGSTFLTMNLAKALAEYEILTSIVELPLEQPKIYINLAIKQKLNNNDKDSLEYLNYYSYAHEINNNGKIEKDKENYVEDIIFIVPDPNKEIITPEEWNFNKMIKLLNATRKAKLNLIDINNSFYHESVKDLMEEIDALLVVIDPNPTEVILNISKLEEIKNIAKETNLKVRYIINKNNGGVNLKELHEYINVEILTKIPFIDISLVYKSLYEGEFLYKYGEARETLNQAFIPIFKELLPVELILDSRKEESPKKKFSFFRRKRE